MADAYAAHIYGERRGPKGVDDSNTYGAAFSPLERKLLNVAREFELEREKDMQSLEEAHQASKEIQERQKRQIEVQELEIKSLKQQLEMVKRENARESVLREKKLRSFTSELIATRFEIADAQQALRAAKKKEKEKDAQKQGAGDSPTAAKGGTDDATEVDKGSSETKGSKASGEGGSEAGEDDEDVNMLSKEMLYYAAEQGLTGVLRKILSPAPADDATSEARQQRLAGVLGVALGKSCIAGSVAIFNELLGLGADIESKSPSDQNRRPLHFAALHGREELVKALLDRDATVDAVDERGSTPLHLAAANDHPGCVEILTLAGSDLGATDAGGQDAASAATAAGAVSAGEVLADDKLRFWNCCTRGNKQYNVGDYAGALSLFSQALVVTLERKLDIPSKDSATINYNCARAAMRLGKHLDAVAFCDRALEHNDDFVKAYKLRAENEMELHDFAAAARDYENALKLDAVDRKARDALANAVVLRDLDHYSLLRLQTAATQPEIKKAYRQQCLKWHPDKHQGSADSKHRATLMFKRIKDAYECLYDPCKRILYDMLHKKKLAEQQAKSAASASAAAAAASSGSTGFGFEQPRASSAAASFNSNKHSESAQAQSAGGRGGGGVPTSSYGMGTAGRSGKRGAGGYGGPGSFGVQENTAAANNTDHGNEGGYDFHYPSSRTRASATSSSSSSSSSTGAAGTAYHSTYGDEDEDKEQGEYGRHGKYGDGSDMGREHYEYGAQDGVGGRAHDGLDYGSGDDDLDVDIDLDREEDDLGDMDLNLDGEMPSYMHHADAAGHDSYAANHGRMRREDGHEDEDEDEEGSLEQWLHEESPVNPERRSAAGDKGGRGPGAGSHGHGGEDAYDPQRETKMWRLFEEYERAFSEPLG